MHKCFKVYICEGNSLDFWQLLHSALTLLPLEQYELNPELCAKVGDGMKG